jgi:dTDP-4-dehydrorhamnose reductase
MRILVTGGNGQLGRSLQRVLAAHDTLACAHAELDVAQPASVAAAFARHRPEVVIHTAALTDTARCEREPALARAINSVGAAQVARACQQSGSRLVAISSNEVFDGRKSSPYLEDDVTGPVNAYGASKLEGERLATAACADTLVVRTSWVYGAGGTNFIAKVQSAATSGRMLSFVADEIAAPTFAQDLAVGICALIECAAPAGNYHLTNGGETSRYDWAIEILQHSGLSATPVRPVTTAELRAGGYDGPRKPAYSVLANARAAALGVSMRPWQEALAAYFGRPWVRSDA